MSSQRFSCGVDNSRQISVNLHVNLGVDGEFDRDADADVVDVDCCVDVVFDVDAVVLQFDMFFSAAVNLDDFMFKLDISAWVSLLLPLF